MFIYCINFRYFNILTIQHAKQLCAIFTVSVQFYKTKFERSSFIKKIGDETNKNLKVDSVRLTRINNLTTQHAHWLIILNNHITRCECEI